jgi:hypothetical protein
LHDAERDVRRLVVRRIGVRHIVRAHRSQWCRSGVDSGSPLTSDTAFSPMMGLTRRTPRSLRHRTSAREEDGGPPALPRFSEPVAVHISIAVHHAKRTSSAASSRGSAAARRA